METVCNIAETAFIPLSTIYHDRNENYKSSVKVLWMFLPIKTMFTDDIEVESFSNRTIL